jgi:GT2 family glycosyltransferase
MPNLISNKAILFDQYSRYKVCADLLVSEYTKDNTILDVGSGEECLLGRFLPNCKITYVDPLLSSHPNLANNQIPNDIFADELDSRLFDFVVSIDTLEHIPQEQRDSFINRLSKLSKKGIILAFPCSDAGDAVETDKWINKVYTAAFGRDNKWLIEHFRYGLPSLYKVLDKFRTLGWNTHVTQNGHTPWLRELLSFTLCALEVPSLQPTMWELSNYFIENLYEFDHQEPCYRQVIVAYRNEAPSFCSETPINHGLQTDVSRKWALIREKIILSSVNILFRDSKEVKKRLRMLDAIDNSSSQNKETFYYRLRDNTPFLKYTYKSFKTIKEQGFIEFTKKAIRIVRENASKVSGELRRTLLKFDTTSYLSSENANKYDILFFSVINWDFRFQRPQQIATRFARHGHRIFYISANLKRTATYTKRQIAENIYEIILPFKDDVTVYSTDIREGLEILITTFRSLIDHFSIKEFVAFVEFPLWYPIVKHLKDEYGAKIIFDCLDNFVGFNNVSAEVAQMESVLSNTSDYCITTSTVLYEKLAQKIDNVILIRNATEFDHFHNLPVNDRLKHINKPIIGYYGAIAEWFDTSVVEHIASQRPNWNIVLIGNTFGSDISMLKNYKNIHILGEKPYAELPEFLYWFDVCIIPFKANELTRSTDPVKFYEYISSGKPVVSSRLHGLSSYNELLYLSWDENEFLQNIEKALKENNENLKKARIESAKANDWETRFYEIKNCIKSTYPLVSIVILTFDNLKHTRLCIESIYSKTAYPNFELVVVDNGSSDETPNYLTALKQSHDNVRVILNKENLGFASANNIGIQESKGAYIILLNNDTIVTRGWINGLIRHFKDPQVGMVGPVTNNIGNEAKIIVDYTATAEETDSSKVERFSDRYTRKKHGGFFEIPRLAMFCVAIPRQTINKIGLLDEQFTIGMFEDDDYSLRINRAGLRLLCAEDVFIHHFGGASFNKLAPAKYQKIFNENRKKFEAKHNIKWKPHKYRS